MTIRTRISAYLELIAAVLGSMILARLLAVGCTKAAALYATRGDERQATRFSRWARQFARMSYMFGELERETERAD